MRDAGIDTETTSQTGQLVVKRWQDAYLPDGHFDQDRMLALVEEVLSSATAEGYSLLRLVAHMDWAVEDFPGVNDLVEYERISLSRSISTRAYASMTWPNSTPASQWTF
jgi:MEDS: MEthanogen/methylotroph, DcmR Sensory domain